MEGKQSGTGCEGYGRGLFAGLQTGGLRVGVYEEYLHGMRETDTLWTILHYKNVSGAGLGLQGFSVVMPQIANIIASKVLSSYKLAL